MPTTPFRPEHEALAASVRRLVEGPLTPVAAQAEAAPVPLADVLRRCDEIGLFGLDDILAQTVAAQELGRLRSGGVVRVVLDTMVTAVLGLRPLDGFVAVVPVAAADVGVAGVSGHLPFVAGGAFAHRCLLLDSQVVVDLAGATVAPAAAAHALRGSAPASIHLDAAPCERIEVDPSTVAAWELARAAAAVAGGWQTWQDAWAYARQRQAFGRPIGKFQVNRHALATAATRLTAAEALVLETAHALSARAGADAAAALLYATTTALQVADRAVQLLGGNGYTTAFDVERSWRDAREGSLHRAHLRRRVHQGGAT